jgi:hypothetical protein
VTITCKKSWRKYYQAWRQAAWLTSGTRCDATSRMLASNPCNGSEKKQASQGK